MMTSSRFTVCVAAVTLLSFESLLLACGSNALPSDGETSSAVKAPSDPFADLEQATDVSAEGESCSCTCDEDSPAPVAEAGATAPADPVQDPDASVALLTARESRAYSGTALRGIIKKCVDAGGELAKIGEAVVKLKESIEAVKTFSSKVKTNGAFLLTRGKEPTWVVWENMTKVERAKEFVKAYAGLSIKIGALIAAVAGAIEALRKGGCVRKADLEKIKSDAQQAKDASEQAIKELQAQLDAEHKADAESRAVLQKQIDELKAQSKAADEALKLCDTCPAK